MQVSIHTPERFAGESQKAYRERRLESKKAARKVAGHGLHGGISSRQQQRDAMRKSGTMGKRVRAYVALMNYFAAKRVKGSKLC